MIELLATIAPLAPRAVGAGDLERAMVLGPIQGDQNTPVKALEIPKTSARLKRFERVREHPIKGHRRHWIKHVADVIVRRDLLHAEQARAIRALPPTLKRSLMGQKRRALHEENRKRRKTDIRHRVLTIATSPLVLKGRAHLSQRTDQVIKNSHPHLRIQETKLVQTKLQAKTSK